MKKLSKKEWVAVGVVIVVLIYTMFGASISALFNQASLQEEESPASTVSDPENFEERNMNNIGGVQTQDLVVGNGLTIAPGMTVQVNYLLKLADGSIVQDSKVVNNGVPFSFIYKVDSLIPGWDIGIEGMKVGGRRILVIPPELGYGAQASGPIPGNSTLVFEIEVVNAR